MSTIATVLSVVSIVMTVASAVYQTQQAKKMREKAREAAEARKGFEVATEGEAVFMPLVYGRAKIGGARVFHATRSTYLVPAGYAQGTNPTADRVMIAGVNRGDKTLQIKLPVPLPGGGVTYVTQYVTVGTKRLDKAYTNEKKNRFMFVQQVLCQGPIQACWDVIVDESRFIDDPVMGSDSYYGSGDSHYPNMEAGFRADVHYAGGTADGIYSENFGDRRSALFTDMSYATVTTALDRENPQFSGVPSAQFLIDGKKCRVPERSGTAPNYTYAPSAGYVSTNNSAAVLYDYLLDTVSGKGLDPSEIDSESFYNAYQICDTVVMTNAPVGGKLWQPTDGVRSVKARDVKLYECNIVLDPRKPIRENTEAILATMGDARLVWSRGKYRLSLQYPDCNEIPVPNPQGKSRPIVLAGTLTDDDLVMGQEITIRWPSISERYNFATVRFSNECENFKEDTASWPVKLAVNAGNYKTEVAKQETELTGFGGYRLPTGACADGWDYGTSAGPLLNSYGVWHGNDYDMTFTVHFIIRAEQSFTGATIEYAFDDSGQWKLYEYGSNTPIYINGSTGAMESDCTVLRKKTNVTLGDQNPNPALRQDKAYTLWVHALDTSDQTPARDSTSLTKGRAAAFRIMKDNKIIWSVRDVVYDTIGTRTYDNSTYLEFLNEDNGVEMETEVYADGITDYYHAIAKAEEIVTTSRKAFKTKLKVIVKDRLYEPGDFVKVNSSMLKLGDTTDLYFRVDGVKINPDFTMDLDLARFDYTFFAWNTAGYEYLEPPVPYQETVPYPKWVTYSVPAGTDLFQSSGLLEWATVEHSKTVTYIVYMCTNEEYDARTTAVGFAEMPIMREIGRTSGTSFSLPSLTAYSAVFGVRALVGTQASRMAYAGMTANGTTDPVLEFQVVAKPWLNADGDLVFQPDGRILDAAYVQVDGNSVSITDVAANSLVPSINYVGSFASAPDQLQLGAQWKQNAVYKNTTDGHSYVLTGSPLGWVIYLESGTNFELEIESTNGTVFRVGQATETTLKARLFKNGAEVTDQTPASWFRWRRVSMVDPPPPNTDAQFNAAYTSGFKQIIVNVDVVNSKATFFCDIISI